MLQIEYKTKKLEKVCTNAQEAEKRHGHDMALKIQQRVDEIQIANIMEIVDYHN
ncbi:MAG: hypothetical protein ACERKN_18530 [Velocimicrobium sp.]